MIAKAKHRPERLGAPGVRRLGALYRAAAADLAIARRRWPGDPVVNRLEDLVGTARTLVYDSEHPRGSILEFFASGYWRRVREQPGALALAAVLLLLPALIAALWAIADPEQAINLVPEGYEAVTERRDEGDLGLSRPEQAAISSFIFTNNIRVSFMAFAGGLLAGLGTVAILLFNGALLGSVGGLATEAGNGARFVELVAAHGVLELSCIVVTAACGLRLGWAMISPGSRKRVDALIQEGRATVEIVLGTMPWLVLAGLVEGFVTPEGIGVFGALAVGCALAVVYWLLVWYRGRMPARER